MILFIVSPHRADPAETPCRQLAPVTGLMVPITAMPIRAVLQIGLELVRDRLAAMSGLAATATHQ
jgi:hypothetical protein